MRWLPYTIIITSVTGCLLLGSWASLSAPAFYHALERPDWAPPGWLFGPVWTVLFLLMGIAGCRLWQQQARRWILGLFAIQLVFNALWSFLFFAWRLGTLALVDIIILDLVVSWLIWACWRDGHRLPAACLLAYLVWIMFATALCLSIVIANPEVL